MTGAGKVLFGAELSETVDTRSVLVKVRQTPVGLGVLRLMSKQVSGQIVIQQGMLTSASTNQGDQGGFALTKLLSLQQGRYEYVEPSNQFRADRTFSVSIDSLLEHSRTQPMPVALHALLGHVAVTSSATAQIPAIIRNKVDTKETPKFVGKSRKQVVVETAAIICLLAILIGSGYYFVLESQRLSALKQNYLAAVELIKREKFSHALSTLDKLLAQNYAVNQVYPLRALCRTALGNYRGACEDYELVLQRHPESVKDRAALALCRLKMGDYALSVKEATKVLQQDQRNWQTYLTRALAYTHLKQFAAAEQDCKSAETWTGGDCAELHATMAFIDFRNHKTENALKHYAIARALDPQNTTYHSGLAECHEQVHNYATAIEEANQGLFHNDRDTTLLLLRGRCRFKLGDRESGIKDFDKAIQFSPCAETYQARAEVMIGEGNLQAARADLQMALLLNPKAESVKQRLKEITGAT